MSGSDSGAVRVRVAPIASTVAAGHPLVNGTGAFITFNVANDAFSHLFVVAAALVVTVLEVGGQVSLLWTAGGQAYSQVVFASALAAGNYSFSQSIATDPNTTVSISQTAALTGGAANCIAAITGG